MIANINDIIPLLIIGCGFVFLWFADRTPTPPAISTAEPEEPIWAELRAVKKWYASDDRLREDDDRQAAMILALEALVEARWRRHMEMEEIPVRDLVRSYQVLGVAVGSEAGSTLLDYAEREIAAGRSSVIREQARARPALADVPGAIGAVWLDDGTELIAYDDGRSEVRPRDPTIPTDG
jgi:hypothetical protein